MIYRILFPLKYIKAAAVGQSEEIFCPIHNGLILQPSREGRREQKNEGNEKYKLKLKKPTESMFAGINVKKSELFLGICVLDLCQIFHVFKLSHCLHRNS